MQNFLLNLYREAERPLYWQLYWQMRQLILDGSWPPGSRLPASRQLAHQLGVARVTVIQAFAQLRAEGYVHGRTGAGTYVAETLPLPPDKHAFSPQFSTWGQQVLSLEMTNDAITRPTREPLTEIDFGFARAFSHSFPYDVWRRLLARYLSTDDIILARYGSVAGFAPLRQAIADYLAQLRGVRCTAEQVVIVSGAQQTIDILSRLLLNPNDTVLVETPGYREAFTLFRTNGARMLALPVDDDGFPVEQIPAGCAARLLFITPSHQFPRGGTMPLSRRLALLQWARTHDALVIEDDYDGELRYDGRPLSALQGLDEDGRVIYLGTFSKVLFPALRLAYVVLPPSLVTPFVQAKRLVDRGAPTLMQAAVADFLREGYFERHLRHLRQAYGRRREVLVAALAHYLPGRVHHVPVAAGLHIMVYLTGGEEETAVIQQAATHGVRVYPGAPYHVQQPSPPSILLGFSGLHETEIEEGVRRLAEAMAK